MNKKAVALSATVILAMLVVCQLQAKTGSRGCIGSVTSPDCGVTLTCSGPNKADGVGTTYKEGASQCKILTFPSNCGVTRAECGAVAVSATE